MNLIKKIHKNKYFVCNIWKIYCSFFIAIILQIMCNLLQIRNFFPSWTMILLIYWIITSPNQINIGSGFILGLILDIVLGPIVGIHALSLSILSYLIVRKMYYFKYFSVWMQSCAIIFFSFINKGIILLTTFLCINMTYSSQILWSCILDGSIWPIVTFFMHKIYDVNTYHVR